MTEELKEYIEAKKGLSSFVQGKYIKVTNQFEIGALGELISLLGQHKIEFAIYDELYPSMSDLGAYITYSKTGTNNGTKWRMTLGNHGWSGGIYEIDENTIIAQLKNLIINKKMDEIQVEGVSFFGHYEVKTETENRRKNAEIIALHSGE